MMDINKIGTFLSAAETLSFSETAKQLHMSQPTISHQIRSLELDMGTVLFTRTNIGLQLTEAGRLLLPWARRLVHDTNNIQTMMASLQSDVVGELRIACSTTAGKYITPQLTARFCRLNPAVRGRIQSCTAHEVTNKLLNGEVHLGVVSHETQDPRLESQEFFRDTVTLIVPADHRWANRKSVEPSELLDELLIMREETAGTRRVVLQELSKFDIGLDDINIFLELGNAEAIVRTVAAGYGIGFVSTLACACPLQCGNVVEVRVEGLNLTRIIYMARNVGSDGYRPRDAFWGFIHAPENEDLIHMAETLT